MISTDSSHPTAVSTSRRSLVGALAVAVFALAVLVTIGWAFDIPALKSVLPGAITMKANTAIALALSAGALVLLERSSALAQRCAIVCALAATALPLATLVEYIAGRDFGIDEWLFADPDGKLNLFPPGRLAPITAVCLTMLLLATTARALKWSERVPRGAAGFVLLASLQTCVGYAFNQTYLFGYAFYTQMALHTAIAFALLALGHLLLGRAESRRTLSADGPIAKLVRVMICAAAVLPITVRWLCRLGLAHGYYDADMAALIEVAGSTGLLVALILISSSALRQSELRRLGKDDELRDRKEEFRALVSTIAQSVWHKDASGKLGALSISWGQLTGQTPEESAGWGWLDALHPDDRAMVRARWERCLRGKVPYEAEYRLRWPTGEYHWTLARSTPLFQPHGDVRGWIGINFDIDARKRAELMQDEARRAAELALAETRKANDLKSAFLANMSHEIRTPLGAILGFAEICAEDDVERDDLRHYLGIIRRNAAQVTHLINEILDLSRIEAGQERVTLAPADLVALVREVVADISILAARKNLAVEVTAPPGDVVLVHTDAQRIKQILTNVIANSIKFTDRGRVDVDVVAGPDLEAAFTVRITDTGIGIAPENHDRIFENFTQVDASDTRRHGGTGLGLTLSRKLARLLGGDLVLVASARDVGSCFAVQVRDNAPVDVARSPEA